MNDAAAGRNDAGIEAGIEASIEAVVAALTARYSTCRMVAAQDVAAALRGRISTDDDLRTLRRALGDHGLSVIGDDVEARLAQDTGRLRS